MPRQGSPAPVWVGSVKWNFFVEGGDRVDADGIPLYTITHWQKALFLDLVDLARPCITLPPIGTNFFPGGPGKWMVLGTAPRNAAFC
jgi:hypothetical protein